MSDNTPEKSENPEKPAEQKPAAEAPQPAAADAAKPEAAKPAADAPKPAAAAAAKPAAAPAAAHAAAAPPAVPTEPGQFGQFLKDNDIPSKRLADSSGVETIELAPEHLVSALKRLRNSPETQLNFLVTVSGVDSGDTIDSVYQLWSFDNLNELIIKIKTPKSALPADGLPVIPSAAPFWQTANWHERETYDLVGIKYVGHPYLRRILNPWDWEGHPLRRDYRQIIDAINDKAKGSFR